MQAQGHSRGFHAQIDEFGSDLTRFVVFTRLSAD